MTGADIAGLITAIFMGIAAVITSIAALRSANANHDRVDALEKENTRLRERAKDEHEHSEYQDEIIFSQHRKLDHWAEWGIKIGRKMNQMELEIGQYRYGLEMPRTIHDTQPLPQVKGDYTDPLGSIDGETEQRDNFGERRGDPPQ